jgi:hypothetical protein
VNSGASARSEVSRADGDSAAAGSACAACCGVAALWWPPRRCLPPPIVLLLLLTAAADCRRRPRALRSRALPVASTRRTAELLAAHHPHGKEPRDGLPLQMMCSRSLTRTQPSSASHNCRRLCGSGEAAPSIAGTVK